MSHNKYDNTITSISKHMKTLLYSTSFSKSLETWDNHFGRWINHLENSNLEYDQILLVDDGSPILPSWDGVEIIQEGNLPDTVPDSLAVIYHHEHNLGHNPPLKDGDPPIDSPGWFRSYMFAAQYAAKYGFEKIILIESDAFLISDRIQDYVNNLTDGWTTFWCPRHQFAENNIQIMAGSSVQDFINWNLLAEPYEKYKGIYPEYFTPYTNVVKDFNGDRWGEFAPGMAAVPDPRCAPGVPRDADFVCQVREVSPCWWIEQ
jgi:hypothetical protein